ncbi:hypothetical protein HMPREF0063_11450 [Aeromicrobium marinum DSM 15272]|uniref:Htaa domain-containing protein n=1 Tax=Aeromicrobium marinum DSM 15272 TaxID=585531 RepID=E2SBP1_9ACTN|nr:HtaA domain-containing protein [Aeromicrobium marinum]EFQ83787.1 hypothetical protein HMPREF0063_11450 [Aeromicrobium marinum DSM 15272]
MTRPRALIALTTVLLLVLLAGGPATAGTTEPSVDEDTAAEILPGPTPSAAAEEPADETDPTPDPTPGPTPSSEVAIDAAQLRWGINHESNNRAFAPGTMNMFRAGLLPDPGRGGQVIGPDQWVQSEGDVSVEKWNGAAYAPATWAGLTTTAAGAPIPSATSGLFSDHQLVFDGGEGTVDPVAGTATIRWDGDATVLYYSGMSFIHLSDPVLQVEDGAGQLTATVGGFASSMTDQSVWGPVAAREVVLADLADVDLSDPSGLTVTPVWDGVAVDTTAPQVRSGAGWGAFPASFVAFHEEAGAASYWYTSGGSTDRFKSPLPVTVIYDTTTTAPPVPPSVPSPAEPVAAPTVVQPPPRNALPPPSRVPTPVAAPPVTAAATTPAAYQPAGHWGTLTAAEVLRDQLVWWVLAAGLLCTAVATVAATSACTRRLAPQT